jgi:hypothetical protein
MRKESANTANDVSAIGRKGLRIEQLNRTAAVKICGLSLFQTGKLTWQCDFVAAGPVCGSGFLTFVTIRLRCR